MLVNLGTLRVTTPDGQVREYPIDVASAFIGRAEGNRVMVDHVSVSRRHARLFFEGGEARLEDLSSATGTYVAGERLAPGQPRPVRPGDALRFGDCHAQLLAPSAAPAAGEGSAGAAGAQQVTAVWLTSPSAPVAPGAAASATVTVQNRGEVADTIAISVQGIPQHWVRITRDSLHLMPDARDEVVVVIQPPREPSSLAGDYEFAAAARSSQRGVEVRALGKLTVLPFGGVRIEARPAQSRGAFTVTVENNSNRDLALEFLAEDAAESIEAVFRPPDALVEAGSAIDVQADVRPRRRRFFGGEERYPFSFQATGAPQPAVASAVLIERPPWLLLRWVLVALLLVGLGVGGWFAYSAFAGDDGDTNGGGETPTPGETATAEPRTPTAEATRTPSPESPTPDEGILPEGSTAVVINAAEPSCLLVRSGPTRVESDPRSERVDRLCDGQQMTILGDRVEAEGFYWYPVRTENDIEGWAAEGTVSGSERYLDAVP